MDDRVLKILIEGGESAKRTVRAKLAHVFLEKTIGMGITANVRAEIVSEVCYSMSAAAVYDHDRRLRRKGKV